VLDEFDGTSWSASDRDLPPSNRVSGPMPAAPGLSPRTPRVEHRSSLSITDELESTWLPTPYPATVVDVPGDWRYSLATLDLISVDGDTRGLEYDVVGLELDPAAEQLVSAPPPPRELLTAGTALPATMPQWIEDLATDVTSEAQSPFERAVLLQDWFRVDGGFDYSLRRGSGSGIEQLETFLGTGADSRVGYCEQFASAMAMMARTLGLPARVAVGFLRAESSPDGSWVYSSYDLHSWPELYFEGTGWIRFEPTPRTQTEDAIPAYTVGRVPDPEAAAAPSGSATPGEPVPSRSAPEDTVANGAAVEETPVARRVAVVLGGLLLLLGVLVAPRLVRGWVRRRRFAGGDPRQAAEGAWGEVRATALDLRRGWYDGTTTRQQAQRLVPAMGDEPLVALETLALLVERSRYSRAGLDPSECERVRELAGQVTRTMLASVDPAARRRATWLPRSLWRRSSQERSQRYGRSRPGIRSTVSEEPELEKVSL
jgi:transglutaminase-like putative cysteine protease